MERAATLLWWGLLVLCAGGIWAANLAARGGGVGEGPPVAEEFAGRYALGAARKLGPEGSAKVLEGLGFEAMPPVARLRMIPVVAEVGGVGKAREMLEGLRGVAPGADLDTLSRIYVDLALPTPDEGFVRRNGWFARLALSRGLPDDHPSRRDVLGAAARTFAASTIGIFAALAAFVSGIVLLPIGLSALSQGRLRFAYEPPPRAASDRVWLETVTILLAGVIGTAMVGGWAIWALALVPLWPLARGTSRAEWSAGLGLSRGRGVLAEVGAGFVGYLAGMPVFAAGILVTVLLSRALGESPSHPAIEEAAGEGVWPIVYLFLTACVWAPLVEEAVFRGALQRYLRPRMSRIAAAALVGLVFAFVHPQGLAAIPALMAIGGWFAILREWRGSLVPSITAHAVHNLALVSLAVLVLG
jgi:membrane protease YdiL (CAAX protease family)